MPLPFRKLTPKMTRMPAHLCELRLESSPIYTRRVREYQQTHEAAKMSAHYYTSAKFRPRYEDVP